MVLGRCCCCCGSVGWMLAAAYALVGPWAAGRVKWTIWTASIAAELTDHWMSCRANCMGSRRTNSPHYKLSERLPSDGVSDDKKPVTASSIYKAKCSEFRCIYPRRAPIVACSSHGNGIRSRPNKICFAYAAATGETINGISLVKRLKIISVVRVHAGYSTDIVTMYIS